MLLRASPSGGPQGPPPDSLVSTVSGAVAAAAVCLRAAGQGGEAGARNPQNLSVADVPELIVSHEE